MESSSGGRLAGKRALVTAAGQGIGRASALAFVSEGAQVVAADINAQALTALEALNIPGLTTLRLDVTDKAAIAAQLHSDHASHSENPQRGKSGTHFDVLFNCAGMVHAGSILECSDADLQRAWQLNVTSMFWLCQALLPGMLAAGRGSIVNVASIASSVKGIPNRFAYSTTKAAVIGLTKSIAADFVTRGIRCNAICPGTVATPSLTDRIQLQAQAQDLAVEKVRSDFNARQPMGRLGMPEEIAALALYLASDESGFTTGAIHIIDGGWVN